MKISVVIPVLNAAGTLPTLLEALAEQHPASPDEIILVDSLSTDATRQIALAHAHVRVVPLQRFSHGRARNLGAREAAGEIIVLMTQDALPADRHWLAALLAPLADSQVAAVYSRQAPRPDAPPTEKFFIAYHFPPGPPLRRERPVGRALTLADVFFSNVSAAVRREVLLRYPFDETLIMSEDQQFARDLIAAGYTIVYQPSSVVVHSHRYSLWTAFRRYFDSVYSLTLIFPAHDLKISFGLGRRYLRQEIVYMLSNHPLYVPYYCLYTLAKMAGVLCSHFADRMPRRLACACSLHRYYWEAKASDEHAPDKPLRIRPHGGATLGRAEQPVPPRPDWQSGPTLRCSHSRPQLWNSMNLAVVILNWNQAAATIRCVEAVAAWTRVAPDIWVVDNASQDGSRDLIPKHCPAAYVLTSDINLGFAGGNNLALRRILSSQADIVLLLNNDAVIAEDQVQRLLTELETHPRLGVVGPLLDERRGLEQVFTAGGRDIARHLGTRHEYPASDLPTLIATHRLLDVDYVPGAAVLVRAEVFRTVGLFDEDYFFSGEMADFCRRAGAQGYASAICPRARATHTPGGGARSTLYRYYTLRNRFLYSRKFYPSRRVLFASGWSAVGLAMAACALIQGRPAEARAAWRALRDGLAGRFGNRNAEFGA